MRIDSSAVVHGGGCLCCCTIVLCLKVLLLMMLLLLLLLLLQAWRVSERLGLIGPACEQPEYNMFARKKVEEEFKPIYDRWATGTASGRGAVHPILQLQAAQSLEPLMRNA
jgi:hypothetical protein